MIYLGFFVKSNFSLLSKKKDEVTADNNVMKKETIIYLVNKNLYKYLGLSFISEATQKRLQIKDNKYTSELFKSNYEF